MCLEEGAATKRGKVEDRNTGFRGQKDKKTKIIGRKCEDGKTEIIKQKDEMIFFGDEVARIEVLLRLSTIIF